MRNQTVKSFLLLSSKTVPQIEWEMLERSMLDANENLMFFFASPEGENQTQWQLVYSIKNQPQVIFNALEFYGS